MNLTAADNRTGHAKSFTTDTETAELGYILPSICEETEAFGPPVSDMIANIVNAN